MRYVLSRTVLLSLLCSACSAGQWQSADDMIQPGKLPVDLGRPLVENPLFENAEGKYGYTITNPIRVAGLGGITPQSAVLYFGRLRGPQKQPVRYRRVGACCDFATPNGVFGPKVYWTRMKSRMRDLASQLLFT